MQAQEVIKILQSEYANASKYGYHDLAEALELAINVLKTVAS